MKLSSEEVAAKIKDAVRQFVQDHLDDDQTSCTFAEAEALADELKVHVSAVVHEIKVWGLLVGERAVAKRVRGVNSNSHDRWNGPGSCPTAGGSGFEQINGFAGREG